MFLYMLTRVTGDGRCQAGASDKYSATPSDLVKVRHGCRTPMIKRTNMDKPFSARAVCFKMLAPGICGPCVISDLFPVARFVGLTTEAMTGRVPCAELFVVLILWSLAWIPCSEIGRDPSLALCYTGWFGWFGFSDDFAKYSILGPWWILHPQISQELANWQRRVRGGPCEVPVSKFGHQGMWSMKLDEIWLLHAVALSVACKLPETRTNRFVSQLLMGVALVAQSGHLWISLCGMRVLGWQGQGR